MRSGILKPSVFALTLVLVAGGAQAEPVPSGTAQQVAPAWPDWPEEGDFVPFDPGLPGQARYEVDVRQLEVDASGVVRYVMRVRTGGGAQTLTYEALRCADLGWQLLAMGGADRQWRPPRNPAWQTLDKVAAHRHRLAFALELVCDAVAPPRDADEVRDRLREAGRRLSR